MNVFEVYLYLIKNTFIDSVLIPFKSDLEFIVLIAFGEYNPLIITTATVISSTAGSVISWKLGQIFLSFKNKEWFNIPLELLEKWSVNFNKYLLIILLFSWVNVIGNPLTVAAGFLNVSLRRFIFFVIVGKAIYYSYEALHIINPAVYSILP